MPVAEATDGVRLQPNHVYVAPPSLNLAILKGSLQLMEPKKVKPGTPRLPIDYFFHSLVNDRQHRAICIVLSGTGTDGTIGLKAIKAGSGMAMVQKPETAKYAGMPGSAMATGLVDYVSPVGELPAQLVAYASGNYLKGGSPAAATVLPPEPLNKIFLLLRGRTGHDFSSYKSSTIRRRIERRMNVHQINEARHYVRFLQENPHEIDLLFKELLISVTNFFRDPQAFDALAIALIPLLKSRPEGYTIRAWVPGCATGEEVYSLAILLRECMDKLKKHFDLQVFGTDLDSDAIESARLGIYPDGIAGDVSPERLERYFVHSDNTYRICKEIREMAVFATQNVIKDPPFTKLDLLSCRNLLIYLDADLQKRLLPVFHYGLKPNGLLFLGPSESVGQFDDRFEMVDKKWKIFRRKDAAVATYPLPKIPAVLPVTDAANAEETPGIVSNAGLRNKPNRLLSTVIERHLLDQFCPASVVVNDRGDIVYVHGRTGDFLELAEGQVRTNVLDMARKGLENELGSAIRQVAGGASDVRRNGIRVKTNGNHLVVDLLVHRIREPESIRGLLMITFQPNAAATENAKLDGVNVIVTAAPGVVTENKDGDGSENSPGLDRESLERELRYMRDSRQSTLEELETSNEELKSTNEELQSTNEELQSTNEELETSKEEMHSLNEELTTVNSELQSRVDELSQANNDMQNLLNSTEIATIFLDRDLNIKRFTEHVKDLVSIRKFDIGRPIGELALNLKQDDLQEHCRNVLKTLTRFEIEVRSKTGKWFLMKIMPYRTSENVIDGLVLTFVDISPLMAGRDALTFSQGIVNTVRQPLVILDDEMRVVSANKAFYTTFKTSEKQSVGENVFELGGAQWDDAELRGQLMQVLNKDKTFDGLKITAEIPKLGRRTFLLNGRRLDREEGLPEMILLAMEEVPNDE